MTVEIFVHKTDADNRKSELDEFFGTSSHQVIKVKIDQSQASVYGFRYMDSDFKYVDSLETGYIVLEKDWTAEEAAKCGLVQISEDL